MQFVLKFFYLGQYTISYLFWDTILFQNLVV